MRREKAELQLQLELLCSEFKKVTRTCDVRDAHHDLETRILSKKLDLASGRFLRLSEFP